jgi:hypothetical protein
MIGRRQTWIQKVPLKTPQLTDNENRPLNATALLIQTKEMSQDKAPGSRPAPLTLSHTLQPAKNQTGHRTNIIL